MLTFVSFIIVMIGSLNWFFIGAFQYDFVAGFFGTQASLLSRLIYFIIGMASFVLLAMAFKNKGKIKITENSFKQKNNNFEINNKKRNNKENVREFNSGNDFNNQSNEFNQRNNPNNQRNELNNQNEKLNSDNFSVKNQKSKPIETSNIKETELNSDVPYGYKDFDVTQYDD